MWNLSNKNPEILDKLIELPDEVIKNIPAAGDGKAEFISMGTEEEHQEFEKEEKGLKGIFGL